MLEFHFLLLRCGKEKFEPVVSCWCSSCVYSTCLLDNPISPREHFERNSRTWRYKSGTICLLELRVKPDGACSKPLSGEWIEHWRGLWNSALEGVDPWPQYIDSYKLLTVQWCKPSSCIIPASRLQIPYTCSMSSISFIFRTVAIFTMFSLMISFHNL
jgi:hypothetical protein